MHSFTKLTPIPASLKENEGFVHNDLLKKRKTIRPKFQTNDLVRVIDLKRTFTEGVTTNWSDKLYRVIEIINDTITLMIYQNVITKLC